ncbi:TetR/AcrR family transcriptional regulator [Actinospongicola halichondriae]|uniref:TetR/AcrR family transcriptional regulator n=1 Tax=Actinospongicola halichondriae TaxID=3236844 RepID=UPI003D47D216
MEDSIASRATKGERTKASILAAASARFARDGFRNTSVADVSRDAGVGGTTAYVHYANKETLFFAAVDDDLTSLFDELGLALVSLGPDDELADRLLDLVLDIVDSHPLARRLLAGLEPDFTARVLETKAFAELRAGVAALLAEGQSEGGIRPDLPADELADGLVAIVVAAAMVSVQVGPVVGETFGPGFATVVRGVLTVDPRIG